MKITQSDIIDALRSALASPSDGEASTVNEIRAATGQSEERVRDYLHAMNKQGRLDVLRVRRPTLDGRNTIVPAYRIKSK